MKFLLIEGVIVLSAAWAGLAWCWWEYLASPKEEKKVRLWQKLIVATLATWGLMFLSAGTTLGIIGGGLFSVVVAVVLGIHWAGSKEETK